MTDTREMTLLEAWENLRILLPISKYSWGTKTHYCRLCDGDMREGHKQHCPWLAVEKAVKREKARKSCSHDMRVRADVCLLCGDATEANR